MLKVNKRVKLLPLLLLLLILWAVNTYAAEVEPGYVLDSSTAVYEGAKQTYLIPPPANFKLVTDEIAVDGYSLAFIPEGEDYLEASTIIAVTIYTLGELPFGEILTADTVGLRDFYGDDLIIHPVDSVLNFAG